MRLPYPAHFIADKYRDTVIMDNDYPPVFTAKTSSVRQVLSLLKCIGFVRKAQVQISSEGVRVTVEDLRVMQGQVFLDKNLFSEYNFSLPKRNPLIGTAVDDDDDANPTGDDKDAEDPDSTISFGISLSALLECLQIFGADPFSRERWGHGGLTNTMGQGGAFETQLAKPTGTCDFIYRGEGHVLNLILEEHEVTTSCELTTYELETQEEIPLARDSLAQKIIMKADWLYDAIQELDASHPDRLIMAVSPRQPFFSLSSAGTMGSTSVEFSNDRSLLETFQVPEPVQNTYKFGLIKHAARAMAIATKVSIRGDSLGVLSLQFMIDHGGKTSFIDFRYLPFGNDGSDSDD